MSRANELVLEILQKGLATGHSASRVFLGQFNVGNVRLLLCPAVQGRIRQTLPALPSITALSAPAPPSIIALSPTALSDGRTVGTSMSEVKK